ncbi:dTMP kinase [Methanococcus voltae]|uniref:Probable thymidylate kinase n=1 Tax=Methanococcus voltae (strain ATCC BAA-1334 / A3) TaxID=456320 RepID=D7DU62_METV3|nr:dTMP kinase [Methanococcus voltae]MCS3900472.1 dTMP kinase [Methanococcus voltae]
MTNKDNINNKNNNIDSNNKNKNSKLNKFIVFEGIDGSGKSTQAKMLADRINAILDYEPTNSEVGKLIRKGLSEGCFEKETLALLFAGDRVEHCKELAKKLEKNHIVCDRYVYSSIVYQNTQGIDIEYIYNINRYARVPDIVVLLDLNPELSMLRVNDRTGNNEIFEKIEFQKIIREKYLQIFEDEKNKNKKSMFKPPIYIKIDANKSILELHNEIYDLIKQHI